MRYAKNLDAPIPKYLIEDFDGGRCAVLLRHLQVEYDEIWRERSRQIHCIGPVVGLGYDLEVPFAVNETRKALPDDLMVVGKQDFGDFVRFHCHWLGHRLVAMPFRDHIRGFLQA